MGALPQAAEAWTDFWREQSPDSHCLAGATSDVRQALQDHWAAFATAMSPGASVIDLGCGAGAAGQAMVSAQPRLRVVGIDIADIPHSRDPRIRLVPRTAMEQLPFGDGSFDGAISQFGFEYGHVERVARELSRVLRPSSPISFLVHHSEGKIATHGELHRQAIEALCGEQLQAAFLSGNAAILVRQLSLIRQQCPHERIIEQAAQGLMRHLTLSPPQREQVWQAVKTALAPELVLLAALEVASISPRQIDAWLAPLAGRFELKPPEAIRLPGVGPLCWKVEGVKRP